MIQLLFIKIKTKMVKRFDYVIKKLKNDSTRKRIVYEQSTFTDKMDSTTSTDQLPITTQNKTFITKSEISIAKTASNLQYILDLYRNRIRGTNITNTTMGGTNLRSLLWDSFPRTVRHIPEQELLVAGNRDGNMVYDAAPLIYFIPFLCSLLGVQTNSIVYNTSTLLATLELIVKTLPLELTALRKFLRQAVSDRLLASIVDALLFCYVLAYVFWSLLYEEPTLARVIDEDTITQEELSNFRNIEGLELCDYNLGTKKILHKSKK